MHTTLKDYTVKALNGMALGLFVSLIIGLILKQIGQWLHFEHLIFWLFGIICGQLCMSLWSGQNSSGPETAKFPPCLPKFVPSAQPVLPRPGEIFFEYQKTFHKNTT